MNVQKTLSIESFLIVLAKIINPQEWLRVSTSDARIRLRKNGTDRLWTPLTAVIWELTGVRVGTTEQDRLAAAEMFLTTTDQVHRIVDAEDGWDGCNGAVQQLRMKVAEIVSRCETEELISV